MLEVHQLACVFAVIFVASYTLAIFMYHYSQLNMLRPILICFALWVSSRVAEDFPLAGLFDNDVRRLPP